MNEPMSTDSPAVPSTSNEDAATELDVYQRAAHKMWSGIPDHLVHVYTDSPNFRAAVDEARRDLLDANAELYADLVKATGRRIAARAAEAEHKHNCEEAIAELAATKRVLKLSRQNFADKQAGLAAARATIAEHTTTIDAYKTLFNYVYVLRAYGEGAPGGNETWAEADRRLEAFGREPSDD